MKPTIGTLLDRIGVLTQACDLDLLLFFSRHPRTLATAEDLAGFVGYDVQQITRSLDILIGGGLLQRSANRTHSARMYSLDRAGPAGGWLLELLDQSSKREGRTAVLAGLKARNSAGPSASTARAAPRLRKVEGAHA